MTLIHVKASHTAAGKRSNARSLRVWAVIHRWTSIVSTLFLLILSFTGLPLIFQGEIDEALGAQETLIDVPASNRSPTLDSIVAATLSRHPGDTMNSLDFAKRWPIAEVRSAPSLNAKPTELHRDTVDLRTGQLTRMPGRRSAVMQFLHTLHANLFFGLSGGLFLAGMALTLVVSIVSGLVLYPSFMRRLGFGVVRTNKSRRVLWLDLHNLTGVVTMAWLLLVAVTGAINTLHGPVSSSVRETMSEEIGRHPVSAQAEPEEAAGRRGSVDAAIGAARAELPAARVMSVFFPGAVMSPRNHYVVLMKSAQMMTQELFYAVLIDARTGTVSNVFEPRGIAKAMLLTEPLHFPTTFPGLAPKIVWAVFDLLTIIVLLSGPYLWISKRHS